jgi:alpha-ketoglutarate-dependent taurine dioxygenase
METSLADPPPSCLKSSKTYVTLSPTSNTDTLLNLSSDTVIPLFKRHGAILFRGYKVCPNDFYSFSSRFTVQDCLSPAGKRKLLNKKFGIQTVNLGSAAFPLHSELSQDFLKPDVCWFYCLAPPFQNGETLICDGCEIVSNLSSESRNMLSKRMLLHSTQMSLKNFNVRVKHRYGDWKQALMDPEIQLAYSLRSPGLLRRLLLGRKRSISQHSLIPCLHKPLFSEKLAFGNFLLFSRVRHRCLVYPTFEDGSHIPEKLVAEIKEVSDSLTIPITWRIGDLLMLDNTRFMHGRNCVDHGCKRMIYTRFGKINFT